MEQEARPAWLASIEPVQAPAIAWPKALLGTTNDLEQVGTRWLEFLSKLPPLQKREFLIWTSHSLLEREEIQVYLAELQKNTIEKITDGEYNEMEITREEFLKQSRWELIKEMYERRASYNHRRRQHVHKIELIWSNAWQDSLGQLLPETDKVSEGILWRLGKLAILSRNKGVGLQSVVGMMKDVINDRKRTRGAPKKNSLLPSDIAEVEAQLLTEEGKVFWNLFFQRQVGG